MIISRAVVSTDDNPDYYEFWPLVAKAWKNSGILPTVAVIGNVNLNHAFGTVIKMPVIEGVPSGFIAQVIRLIIPCYFPDEIVITGDIDMIPLSVRYFTEDILKYDQDEILIFSADAYKTEIRYPMCYIAAKGKYFQELIGLKTLDLEAITTFIKCLYAQNKFWDTDELYFAACLHGSALLKRTVFLNRGGWKPFAYKRIDRSGWKYSKLKMFNDNYIDAHCLRPLHKHPGELQDLIEYVNAGSNGKRYLRQMLTRPFKALVTFLELAHQNVLKRDLYAIADQCIKPGSNKLIISFSLYGNDPRYFSRLAEVLGSYQNLLHEWTCRIYLTKDAPPTVLKILSDMDCEYVIMDHKGIDSRYLNWRFLAVEDESAAAVIIRDLDSIVTMREKRMIDQWIISDKIFHIIRDHVNHNTRIMGGIWGIKRNHTIDIQVLSKKMVLKNMYGIDQIFLENLVYPMIKDNVMIHDSHPRFPEEDVIIVPLQEGEAYIGEIATEAVSAHRDNMHNLQYNLTNFTIN